MGGGRGGGVDSGVGWDVFGAVGGLAIALAGEPGGAALPRAVPEGPPPPTTTAAAPVGRGEDGRADGDAAPPPTGHLLTATSTVLAASSGLSTVSLLAARNDPDYDVPGSRTQIRRDAARRQRQDVAFGINAAVLGLATAGAVVGAIRIHRFDRWRYSNGVQPLRSGAGLTGAGVGLLLSGVVFGASTGPSCFYRRQPDNIGIWAGLTTAYLIGGSVATALGIRKQRRRGTELAARYGFSVVRGQVPGRYAFGLHGRSR